MAEKFANVFATTLAAAIVSTSVTTITTAAAAPAELQGGEFRIRVDSEFMLVTAGQTGTSWTVTRGVEGSVAATHLINAPVYHILTASALRGVLDLKADLASPVFTGSPQGPTAAPGDSSTLIATTSFVAAAVAAAQAGLSVKASAKLATAAALPANTYLMGVLTEVGNGALSVDGSTPSVGDRILAKNEAAGANNGLYMVTAVGDGTHPYVLTRTTDMDSASEVPGAFVFVESGTVNSGAGFVVSSAGPFTIGTTAITWTQFSGAGEITVDGTLTKTGNQLGVATDVALPGNPTVATQAQGNSTTRAASTAYVQTEVGLLVPKALVTTKGDLVVGGAAGAVARKAVGTDGQVLTADSTKTDGLTYAEPSQWRKPADYGLLGYTYPPNLITAVGGTDGSGIWHVGRIILDRQQTITGLQMWLSAVGVTFTTNRNFAAIWTVAASPVLIAWASESVCTTAWVSGAPAVRTVTFDNTVTSLTLAAGAYYVGFSSAATTAPTFGRFNGSSYSNWGRTTAQGREMTSTAAVAANTPPNTVSPLPALSDNVKSFCVGLV